MYAVQNQNKSYLSITEWWVKISTGSTRIVHSQHNYLDTFIPHCFTRLYIEGYTVSTITLIHLFLIVLPGCI